MVVWRKIQNEGAVSWWCREHKLLAETLFVMAEQGGEMVSGILVYWRKKVGHERIGNKKAKKGLRTNTSTVNLVQRSRPRKMTHQRIDAR